ncbi:MAG: dynamin family protein [Sulfurifustaceae bacterium]
MSIAEQRKDREVNPAPTSRPAPSEQSASLSFAQALARYRAWCDDVAGAIAEYQNWIEQQGQAEGEQDLRIYELAESLKSERLRVALVAEFSRGKTELLNAIFFSSFKQRLLPSTAGRTTMCPTELGFDESIPPSIRLLPIETRKTSTTISEYKSTPVHWTTIHILRPNSAEEVRQAFLEVVRTKKVSAWEAQELGLYTIPPGGKRPSPETQVEVPVWRHAIINFPHPLLRQGLVVLDTPGLNALGAEPELTYRILPDAHALVFVLAADAGVTKSDLEVWHKHVIGSRGVSTAGRFVVLNKIDILWDELQDEKLVRDTIARQVDETARNLNVAPQNIFAVSAQKALAGRANNDVAQVERSGITRLESSIAQEILPAKHELMRSKVIYEVSGRLRDSHSLLQARVAAADKQLSDLKQLGGRNLDAIHKMVNRMREEKQRYDRELKGFETTRLALAEKAKGLLAPLSLASLDSLIQETRVDMHESWTTHGLKQGMRTFFSGTRARLEDVSRRADALKREIETIYGRLHAEYGFTRLQPAQLSLLQYVIEFNRLEEKADAFRESPVTVMTEQSFVIKKFFITLVSEARRLFDECNRSAMAWFHALVKPLYTQLQDHRAAIDTQLENLRKIHKNMDTLGAQIADLEAVRQGLNGEMQLLGGLLERIQRPLL